MYILVSIKRCGIKSVFLFYLYILGKPQKKSSSLNGWAIKRGGGVKGPTFQQPLSWRGGGGG